MKLWGGRFSGKMDPQAWRLNASIGFDRRLGRQDVRGSLAWAAALEAAGVLNAEERQAIQSGLREIDSELAAGEFDFVESDEDIHTAVERRLAS
jgi:argininosuccinate lyase